MSRNIRGNFLILLQCFCYKILAWMEKKKRLNLFQSHILTHYVRLPFVTKPVSLETLNCLNPKVSLLCKYIYSVINDP